MKPATIRSADFRGIQPVVVNVEAEIASGLRQFKINGLCEAAVRETRIRVEVAIKNSGFVMPEGNISIRLQTAEGRRLDGSGFDLPIALAILSASEQIESKASHLVFGQLTLSGGIQPVRGAFLLAQVAKAADVIICDRNNVAEAWDGCRGAAKVVGCGNLKEAVQSTKVEWDAEPPASISSLMTKQPMPDFGDVRLHEPARRAMEVAAAGGFNVALLGPMGAGKTMLARRMNSILPPLLENEMREITAIHSAAGLNMGGRLIDVRPFRAPHHSTTPPGLVGGGNNQIRPGEVALAHGGVLFLDQVAEFSRTALEYLREPLLSKKVILTRASGSVVYPSNTILICSSTECPCGGVRSCACTTDEKKRYLGRAESVLRLCDIKIRVPLFDLNMTSAPVGEKSETIRERVVAAWTRQLERKHLNRDTLPPYSAVARTIADLAGAKTVGPQHLEEARGLIELL